jgi:hypothetical protein
VRNAQWCFSKNSNTDKSDVAEDTTQLEELTEGVTNSQSLVESPIKMQPVLVFGQSPTSPKSERRRSRRLLPEQPSLFGWN